MCRLPVDSCDAGYRSAEGRRYAPPMTARATVVFFALLAGCGPGGGGGQTVDDHCERFGEQCRLREGLLGVCSDTGDTDCESPPCLVCQPQH